ncbi:MAG TPA: hypothetical protein VGO16_10970 [Pseudonocardiaceae bacterium]|nr:hypothetical protein [Pseudonocardiaceae bacterium]
MIMQTKPRASSITPVIPPNMVARVMGHEKITTTLQLYTRRTDDEGRILGALTDEPGERDDPDDDDGPTGAPTSNR